jgi:hypothetical protein
VEIPEELAHEGLVPQPSSRYVPHHRGKPRTAASARAENPHEPVCSELVHDLHCGRLGREWQSTEKGAFVGLANRNKNKKRAGEFRKNERKYILSGFVRCSICGYACNGRTSTSRVSESPKKYAYYSCASNRAYPGGAAPPHRAPNIAADWMEDLVWADVRAFLENPGVVLERLRSEGIDTDSSLNELETRRDDLTKRLAAKNAEKDRYIRTYAQGHISEEELADYMTDIKYHADNLRLLISSVEDDLASLGASRVEVQSAAEWLSALREGVSEIEADSPEAFQERRELVRLLVEGITTDRDENGHPRVEITHPFGPPREEPFVPSVRNPKE